MIAKYALLALGCCASHVAWAETVNAVSTGKSEVAACANAKANAARQCETGKVKKYESCQCETGEFSGGDKHQCAIDAVCEAHKGEDEHSSTQKVPVQRD
ncbi:hypothetical protein [Pseudoxanthomonas sacheonensis]|uniref:hypothetical protein n=1 Tax=Pseudoxanthomonas sacheonensis TaxID=443615 RepID=UPI0013D812E4|nr:hypothetical protein [Pseudoxanthomonas sacheonensis]